MLKCLCRFPCYRFPCYVAIEVWQLLSGGVKLAPLVAFDNSDASKVTRPFVNGDPSKPLGPFVHGDASRQPEPLANGD